MVCGRRTQAIQKDPARTDRLAASRPGIYDRLNAHVRAPGARASCAATGSILVRQVGGRQGDSKPNSQRRGTW